MIDLKDFKTACSRFVTGVTVVTSMTEDHKPVGMTASSFTSVSLEPALVLVCIHKLSSFLTALLQTRTFGLNVLAAGQEELSNRFAERREDRFAGIAWRCGVTGVPILSNVLATLECDVHDVFACGDHQVVIGAVRTLSLTEGTPLARFASSYRFLAEPIARPSSPTA